MGLARLGTPVSFVGVVGHDVWGEYCLNALRARDIDVSAVRVDGAVRTGELRAAPAFCVDTIDTTGAGDSFNAGFLHAWLRGDGLDSALKMGCACGALSTQAVGGTAGQPTLAQAKSLIASTGE